MKAILFFIRSKTAKMLPGLLALFFLHGLSAAPQDVDLTGPNPNPPYEDYQFTLGVAIPGGTAFGVLNATGNVFWEFTSAPAAVTTTATTTSFTFNGVTVTLPAGTDHTDTGVPSTATATITGTPTSTLPISFTVNLGDGTNFRNRTYELFISQQMDLVFVLDRSGSMGINTPAGITRWQALTQAAGNFANELAALGRAGDRVGITYFHTAASQPAPANFPTPLINVNNMTLAATVNAELSGQAPSGWTAMGAGMQDAQGKLTDAARARYMLLLTDGEQNQNPMVNNNGQGYSDGTTIPDGIKIFTIGIDGPGGPDLTTLQNLAVENDGNYVDTDDGSLKAAFISQFANSLAAASPQLVASSKTPVNGAGPFTLQSFPVNKRVDKLLIELTADKRFEKVQLLQWLARITIEKDGANVTNRARPTWVSNYTNTILLTFDFKNPPSGAPPITPEGNWTVKLADVTSLKMNECQATTMADDHRLDYTFDYGNATPRVNTPLKPSVTLHWLGNPITDATVQAVILRPDQDLGDFLANNPLKVDPASSDDAPSPGVQKYNQLWANDPAFRAGLAMQENVVNLTHTGNGKYEGEFNGLTVAGNYRIVYRISGEKPETGKYQRFATESIYVSFNGIDLAASAVQTTIDGNKLIMTFKPKTSYGKLLGPAFGNGFTVDNPGVKIEKVVDNQDGSYTITFTGNINEPVSLKILDQEIYKGKLSKIAEGGGGSGFLGRIQAWLESLGLPGWFIWIILLIIAFLLWLLFKKKK